MDTGRPGNRVDRPVAVVAITRHGVGLALRLQAAIEGSVCYVPERHRFALAMGARGYRRVGDVFPEIWASSSALVCIMATGIVVRQIAPFLRHKAVDPAVVVLDERGDYVISLLAGHLGGANELAREIAGVTGGRAVITTASDVREKPALDLIARQAGLEIENIGMLPRVARAVLEEEPLWVYDPEGRILPFLGDLPGLLPPENLEGDSVGIWVSERHPPANRTCLVLRPRNLVVGVGCNRGTPADEILALIRETFRREELSLLSIRNLSSIDLKADEAGLLEAAIVLDRPVRFFSPSEIENIPVPNPSKMVTAHIGVPSICEATALRSTGSGKLLAEKRKTPNVTVAVARVDSPS